MKDRRSWIIAGILVAALVMVIDLYINGADFMMPFLKGLSGL